MKKGFTLIELLAVILILGIIALIAIPTVNNILSEARYGAFKASGDSVLKATQSKCQTSQIKNESPVLYYYFNEFGSSNPLDIKGSLPTDGYIALDNNCETYSFNLSDGKFEYKSENNDEFYDYMLDIYGQTETIYDGVSYMFNSSLFDVLYEDKFDNFKNAYFVNHLNIPEGAIDVKDPSVSKNGKIKSWLIPNGDGYDLYVGSEGKIFMNHDSSYLFAKFKTTVLNLSNLYSDYAINFNCLFQYYKGSSIDISHFNTSSVESFYSTFDSTDLTSLDLSNFNTSNGKNFANMFNWSDLLTSLDLSSFDTSKAENMRQMFMHARGLESINVSSFDTSNVLDMRGIFGGINIKSLDLRHFDVSKVKNLELAFGSAPGFKSNLEYVDISTWDTSSATNMSNMFSYQPNLQEVKIGAKWNTSGATTTNMFTGVNKGSAVLVNIG